MKRFLVLALFAGLCACHNTSGHLSRGMMTKVMLDIHLAEAYSNILPDSAHKPAKKNIDSLGGYYKDIFAHYKITEQQFNSSLDWYRHHPEEMDSLYIDVLAAATKLQSQHLK